MKFKAVLFDLDGTLVDSLPDIGHALNLVLGRRGFPPHELEAYKFMVGDGSETLVRRALPPDHRDQETAAAVLAGFTSVYRAACTQRTRPYDGIKDMIAGLAGRGLTLAVLSNKPQALTALVAGHFFPERPFRVVFGAREGVPVKPDPQAALEIAQMLGLAPADFLYLGDTSVDMRTARAAGMYGAGVSWGFRPREELIEHGARVIIDHPQEAEGLVLG